MHILKDAYAFASNREIRNLAIYKFWLLHQRFLTCGPRTPGGLRRLLRRSATV
jgi:hypothetical protein